MSTKKSKKKSKVAPLEIQQGDSVENISAYKNGQHWGKQTQLSLKHFAIGKHTFENHFIDALVSILRASQS
jgi:fumarate hydratase class II